MIKIYLVTIGIFFIEIKYLKKTVLTIYSSFNIFNRTPIFMNY